MGSTLERQWAHEKIAMNELRVEDRAQEARYLVASLQEVAKEQSRQATQAELKSWVARRNQGESLAHIRGYGWFWSLKISLNRHALIPRPETETLIEALLEIVPKSKNGVIVDAGSGTGAVAAAICSEYPKSYVIAADLDRNCCTLSDTNIRSLGFRAGIVNANWLGALRANSVDIILSNPPYLACDDVHLKNLSFEPYSALVSGPTGLECYLPIIQDALRTLKSDGLLFLECAPWQAEEIAQSCASAGLVYRRSFCDLGQRPRVVLAQKP